MNCGSCGTKCTYENAFSACVAGTCQFTSCSFGFGDCDGSTANGCETDVLTSDASCGACGVACTASEACFGGVCRAGPCTLDFRVDPSHCGACDVQCPVGRACAHGVCTASPEVDTLIATGTWTDRGPGLGGRLSSVFARAATVGGQPGVHMLVGSPGGGVWKTDRTHSDGSPTWSWNVNSGLADFSTVHLERDVADPSRLYLATYTDLYASTDEGTNWTSLDDKGGEPAPVVDVSAFFSQVSDARPFAQLNCGATTRVFRGPPCGGLEYSMDSGAPGTFVEVLPFSAGSPSPENCIVGITADDLTGSVYLTTSNNPVGDPPHVWRSKPFCNWCDAGAAGVCNFPGQLNSGWILANNGLPASAGENPRPTPSIAWTGFPFQLSILVQDPTDFGVKHYFTQDGGAGPTGWTLGAALPATANHGQSRSLLWAGDAASFRLFNGNIGAYTTGGLTQPWTEFTDPNQHVDVRAIFAEPAAAGGLGKVFDVTDGSWSDGSQINVVAWDWPGPASDPANAVGIGDAGLLVWQPLTVAAVPGMQRLFLGSIDNSSVCTDDGGSTWPAQSLGSDVPSIVVGHPSDSNVGYSIGLEKFLRTSDASSPAGCQATTWSCPAGSPLCNGLSPPTFNANILAVDPRPGQQDVFALANPGVWLSTDGGATALPAPLNMNVWAVYIDDEGFLFAGSDEEIRRCDTPLPLSPAKPFPPTPTPVNHPCLASAGWSAFGSFAVPPVRVLSVRKAHPPGPDDPTYWAATASGLYRGIGSPVVWTLVTGGAGYVVNEVETFPQFPGCVYAALGLGSSATWQHRGGVRFSSQNGAPGTWTSITAGHRVHNVPIADVLPDADPHVLWAAAYGAGLARYDWGSALPAACGGP